ncbi:MAG TPA: S-methyl-5-thioribose-1-phosphate isomerase [Kofleriaceae bacterium]
MKVAGTWRRTIETDGKRVVVLDQAQLPYAIEWMPLSTVTDVARAIRDMTIRGAPLIGATAAYGVAIATHTNVPVDRACAELAQTRPTAINLRWALTEMKKLLAAGMDPYAAAAKIADDDVAACEAIGEHGLRVVKALGKRHVNILTHCNAGWLATVDWGTALAPIYKAHEAGIDIHVWVEETRPRNQGMLTAWELLQHGVPHTVIADNAGGHLMQHGKVDLCIVGTDRTTRNGDVCNKIGTYLKALAAHDNNVPFYAAVPSSSIDWTVGAPEEIPIEERSGDEVRFINGYGGRLEIVPRGSAVANPAFDVTPRKYMTGLITERGVASPPELARLFDR